MKDALSILRFLRNAVEHERECVLVTLTEVVGSSARSPGTHMAVHENGSFVGSFSSGCVEAAVVSEALSVLESGVSRQVRFGAGSAYIDIRLPCGGGIDLLFTPNPPLPMLHRAIESLEGRRRIILELAPDGSIAIGDSGPDGWSEDIFRAVHEPDLRLLIFGHGAETIALAKLALAFTPNVEIASPDRQVLLSVQASGALGEFLLTPTSHIDIAADADTAVVFLFHDHDWETDLLRKALSTNAFYIGAMGSRRTQARRRKALLKIGCAPASVARIVGPAGLIPATRDPDTLAVSMLSQIVLEHQQTRQRSQATHMRADPGRSHRMEGGLCCGKASGAPAFGSVL